MYTAVLFLCTHLMKNAMTTAVRTRIDATFGVFTAVKIQVDVFWVLTPCSVVVGYQRFRDPRYLHLMGFDAV
jgi:hypothetical protein